MAKKNIIKRTVFCLAAIPIFWFSSCQSNLNVKPPVERAEKNWNKDEFKLKSLIKQNKFEEASLILKDQIKKNPGNVGAKGLLAEIYYRQGNKQNAFNYLSDLIKENPKDQRYLELRGIFLKEKGFIASARDDLKKLYSTGYRSVNSLLVLTEIARIEKKLLTALTYISEAVDIYENSSILWSEKSLLELQLGKYDDALDSAELAMELDKKSLSAVQLYVEALEKNKEYKKEQEFLEKQVQQHASVVWFHQKLINIALLNRNINQAKKYNEDAIKLFPKNSKFYFQYAIINNILKKPAEAAESLETGLKYDPEFSWARLELAKTYFSLGKKEEAIAHLLKAKKLGNKDSYVYSQLVKYYLSLNDTLEAEKIILEGLGKRPSDLILLTEYARVLERKQKYKEAIRAYKEVLKLTKNKAAVYARLGRVYYLLKDWGKSLEFLDQAISYNKKSYTIRAYRVETLIQQESWNAALKDLDRILQNRKKDYWAYAQRAIVKRKLKQYDQGYADIIRAGELAPDKDWIKAIKVQFELDLKKYPEAEIILNDLLLNSGDNPAIYYQKAFVNYRLGKKNEALSAIDSSIANSNADLVLIEFYLFISGEYQKYWNLSVREEKIYQAIMEREFEKANELLKTEKVKTNNLAVLNYLLSIYQDSNFKLEIKNLDQKKLSFWNLYYLGTQYLAERKTEESIKYLKKAEVLKSTDPWLQSRLGLALEKAKDIKASVVYYEAFLKQQPDNTWVKLRLAYNYDQLKKFARAEKIYLAIIKDNPKEDTALNNLAWLYLTTTDKKFQKVKEALSYSERAVKIRITSANLDTLAEAYFQSGMTLKAIKTVERAIDIDKNKIDYFKKQKKKFQKALKESQKKK